MVRAPIVRDSELTDVVHTADSATSEQASDEDADIACLLLHTHGVEGKEQYYHGEHEGGTREGDIIHGLHVWLAFAQDDGAVADEVHTPNSYAAHCD